MAVVAAALTSLLDWRLGAGTGLLQVVYDSADADQRPLVSRLVPSIDLGILDGRSSLPANVTVRWSGAWHVTQDGFVDLSLSGGGATTWRVDGDVALAHGTATAGRTVRTVFLTRGFHAVEIEYDDGTGPTDLQVSWTPAGGTFGPLGPEHLLPDLPEHPERRAALELTRTALRWGLVAALAGACWLGLITVVPVLSARFARGGRLLASPLTRRILLVALPAAVVAYGAVLRFDALTMSYGPVQSPAWLQSVQEHSGPTLAALRPDGLTWSPERYHPHRQGPPTKYISDPYTYLQYAREMRSFYAAHYREPVFPFATKVALWLLDDQDVAVSFASALFSVLAVLATYLLGTYAFSRWTGSLAAMGMAMEHDVISLGIGGWRDDAFTAAVAVSAYAFLRYAREPTRRHAVFVGVCGGLACLIRITAVSFLAPAFIYVLLAGKGAWTFRLKGVGLAILTTTVIAAPYVINCWRTYGDPLYAINYHTQVYEQSEGRAAESPSAAAYVGTRLLSRPARTLDTIALGMTSYPFANKWRGFEPWLPGLGAGLAYAALLGLMLMPGSPPGRFLLLFLAAALLPYAVTWRLIADWRFTAHAYPFFLIAAGAAITQVVSWLRHLPNTWQYPTRRVAVSRVTAGVVILVSSSATIWCLLRVLPARTVTEALAAGEMGVIEAGNRDTVFFGDGWSDPWTDGNVTSRVARSETSTIWLPLPRARDYALRIRMDPFPRPLPGSAAARPRVHVFLNGTALHRFDLTLDADRVGLYELTLPGSSAREGWNRLDLMVTGDSPVARLEGRPARPGLTDGATFKLWHLLLAPK